MYNPIGASYAWTWNVCSETSNCEWKGWRLHHFKDINAWKIQTIIPTSDATCRRKIEILCILALTLLFPLFLPHFHFVQKSFEIALLNTWIIQRCPTGVHSANAVYWNRIDSPTARELWKRNGTKYWIQFGFCADVLRAVWNQNGCFSFRKYVKSRHK